MALPLGKRQGWQRLLWPPSPVLLITVCVGFLSIRWATQGQKSLPRADDAVTKCRCMPGDECWPTPQEWNRLNTSVHGRLIATDPIGSPCHDPTYDNKRCRYLKDQWTHSSLHDGSSHSIMAPFFANRSCDVWTPREWPCELGNYARYSIDVGAPQDIVEGIAFAKEKNIRLVVRNTGHDYLGKSTGAGSLAIWTHHRKSIEVLDYKDPQYEGKAMKVGAGVQAYEAYQAADKLGLAVVGGECPTVGLAGGYTQGGGHSALASKYGLAADQTLELEVIDGNGNFVKASRSENSDLYWALSGGGGGTYGVVYSMTVKAHPDLPTTGAKLSFDKEGLTEEAFWDAIEYYHSFAHTTSAAGGMTVYIFTEDTFNIMPLTMPGKSEKDVRVVLKPFTTKLSELGIKYDLTVEEFPGYLQHHDAMFDFILVGIAQYGGRLIPQTVIETKNHQLTNALKQIVEDGSIYIGVSINVSHAVAGDVYNAVLPAWREAGISAVLSSPWEETATWEDRVAAQRKMTDEWIPKLTELAPESGCYMNEGDFQDPDWRNTFFGRNYERLLRIKDKYDPEHVFYALTAVGSDYWQVMPDGRLCRSD